MLSAHNNSAHLWIDFGIQTSIANKIHDPSFGIIVVHVQLFREHSNINALVDAAVGLKNEKTGVFQKLIPQWNGHEAILWRLLAQEEVAHDQLQEEPLSMRNGKKSQNKAGYLQVLKTKFLYMCFSQSPGTMELIIRVIQQGCPC
jgi:hypothetical protein